MLTRLLLLAVALNVTLESCPFQVDLNPCKCYEQFNGETDVVCQGITNEQDFLKVARHFKGGSNLHSVILVNATLTYIPSDVFKGLKFEMLLFESCSMMSLTDTDTAFEGLESSLVTMSLSNCNLLNDWDWFNFRNLRELALLSVVDSDIISIESMENIIMKELMFIVFAEGKLRDIADNAFSGALNLQHLELNNNEISHMRRNMLSNPSKTIETINLSNNYIEKLPEDMFSNMPKLKIIKVAHNKILFLDEKVFKPVWKKLELFEATGNELTCDCRMKWIFGVDLPSTILASCTKPKQFSGINIADVPSNYLKC